MRSTRIIALVILPLTLLSGASAAASTPLHLADVGQWTPTATLDTSQVETPKPAPVPVGPVCEAVDTAYLPDSAILDLLDFGWTADDDGRYLYNPACD